MDFEFTPRARELRDRMRSFMEQHVYPNERVYDRQLAEADDPHALPPVMRELKEKARAEGLWNLFMSHGDWGAGLSNLEYAPLAELAGRSIIGPEVFNCSAPDTGNMELLALFGTPQQQDRWLVPLLAAEIRSCFAMTEPEVASSDPRNLRTRITRDGDEYVVDGRKWYTSGILDPDCELIILMGVSDPDAPTYRQQSMVLIPRDAHHLWINCRLTPANCAASGTVSSPREIASSTARFASGSFRMFTIVNSQISPSNAPMHR